MKLLCDVCENAVASLICCADEAALCSSCDSRVHAANKLASKHQRMPLLSEVSEPVVCDICQERPSFFFCIEDRALLCRECDGSIHSASTLAAKHRRFLLTGLQVGVCSSSSPSQETTSTISLEQHVPADMAPSLMNSTAAAVKKPGKQAATTTAMVNCSYDSGGFFKLGETSKGASKKQVVTSTIMNHSKADGGIGSKEAGEKANKVSAAPAAMNVKALRRYLTSKQGTSAYIDNTDHRKEAMDNATGSSTTISIQRISAGKVPFVAPVLSTLRAALMQEEASNNVNNHKNANLDNIRGKISDINNNSNHNVMMDVDDSPLDQSDNVSDYLVSGGLPGWRLDELLTDLVGVCESGSSFSPTKENNALGFGIQEDPPWYADLDAMEEHGLSPSSQEGVALVPEMPSPPTASGLVTSCGKPTCPAAQPWAFDYLFTDPHHSSEFSVVPDIDGRRSSPLSTASPTRGSISKKRKFWLDG